MSTPYSLVDNSFLNKITDDLLLTMTEEDLELMINMYRSSAEVRFKQCTKLSDKDTDTRVYGQDLTSEEVEILANLMVLEWLKQRINSIELLKQNLSTRDYKMYSQANHIDSLISLRKNTLSEVDNMIVSYTYSQNNLSNLRKV